MIARPVQWASWRSTLLFTALAVASPLHAQTAEMPKSAPPAASAVPETEDSDVATLPPLSPHWAFITDGWAMGGTRIIDGDTGHLVGVVHNGPLANFAIDPLGRYYYMAESIWTKGNRGTRQDMVTVYDTRTLKIVSEIALPGRLLIGNRNFNLTISNDGKYAFVYNMDPASSVLVVDIAKRKFVRAIEVPGCGLAIPAPDGTTTSLCADGGLATVKYDARMAGVPARSAVFFSGEHDPIFDNSALDTKNGKALFLTYTGLVYEVALGANPKIPEPWSIQEAGGLPKGVIDPLIVNWLPGGRQPITFNRETGKAYVLMHMGEYWSQKTPGVEVWEIDVAQRKVLRRKKIEPTDNIAVTQGPAPLLFLNTEDGKMLILDVATFEQKFELKDVGSGNIAVAGS
jgi:methylamine dehydrogenase heavy chain